ncbi:MAG: hypothetical protein J1F67_02800 [Muribaculaceae bacterium]|nr:hypothetical protein [Muribaculaceae bacterium]MCH5241341.1 hypothetical protein [Muribaculaceae bacterium]
MKTLSIICYIIGAILLIVSCFMNSEAATWWIGGIAVIFLIGGCVFQYTSKTNRQLPRDNDNFN